MAHTILILGAAYLIGAIPWSYLLGRLAGRDIRRLGDGNVGAHNVMRHIGRGWGLVALALDMAKGALAVLLALQAGPSPWLPVAAGWLAICGHNYPLWLGFRGGKGLAPGLGVGLALFPGLAWLTLGCGVLSIAATRNLAFSGVMVGLALSVAAAWLGYGVAYTLAPLGVLLLMGWKQLPDLRRMWRETPDKRDLILNRWIRNRRARL